MILDKEEKMNRSPQFVQEQFQQDDVFKEKLGAVAESQELIKLTVKLATEKGYTFTEG